MLIELAMYLFYASLLASIIAVAACMAASQADEIRQRSEQQLQKLVRLRRLGQRQANQQGSFPRPTVSDAQA